MEIIIECDLLKKKGNEMIEKSKQLENKINNLSIKIDVISNSWNSDTGRAYVKMLQEKFILPLQNLKAMLEKKGNFLVSTAKVYSLFEEYYYNTKIID